MVFVGKQKIVYVFEEGLVGWEMLIRDRIMYVYNMMVFGFWCMVYGV